jgi:hypothetical protein
VGGGQRRLRSRRGGCYVEINAWPYAIKARQGSFFGRVVVLGVNTKGVGFVNCVRACVRVVCGCDIGH